MLALDIFEDIDRHELVEFPFIYCQKFLTILQKPSLVYQSNSLNIIGIFPISIWILILIAYIIIFSLSFVNNSKTSIPRTMLLYLGIFLSQTQKLPKNKNRILISTFLLSTFFLVFIFKNDILSKMINEDSDYIKNLDDLLTRNYSIFMPPNAYQLKYLNKVMM